MTAPTTPTNPDRTELSRRDALRLGAFGAGAALALGHLPASLRRAIANPTAAPGLDQVEHVILYMQENRSFDHYFGTLSGVRGFGDRTAVRTRATESVFEQAHPSGGTVMPFSTREAAERQGQSLEYIESAPHGWDDGVGAWARGWNDGWIANKGPMTMCYLDRSDIPFHYEMADAFTICDAYHCSVPSSTSPNRNHFVSGYTGFEPGSHDRAVTNAGYDAEHAGYDWPTYAELLEDAGVSWKVYHEWDDFLDNNLDLFKTFIDIEDIVLAEIDGGPYLQTDAFYMSLFALDADEQDARLAQLDAAVDKLPERQRNLFNNSLRRSRPGTLARSMADDIEAGTFPTVAWVVTPAADCEHPSSGSPIQGARITHDVLDALASHREVWDHTASFYTLDENDGLFDHVPAPTPPLDDPDERTEDGRPVGLGARVPMIVISPWTVGGWVCSETFDHTSMIQFLEVVTGVSTDQITPWRRQVTGDLTSAFDFTTTGTMPRFTPPGAVPEFVERWRPEPPAEQALPEQEPGTRPARPLPYQTDAFVVIGEGLDVTLSNAGSKSAHFSVYNWHDVAEPIQVDVDFGSQTTVNVPFGGVSYDVTVLGPNRFRRDFAGSSYESGAMVEVTSVVTGDERARTIALGIANRNDAEDATPVTVTVAHEAYADDTPKEHTVHPGALVAATLDVEATDGWYDISVAVEGDPVFRRRLTGHIENGLPSVTG